MKLYYSQFVGCCYIIMLVAIWSRMWFRCWEIHVFIGHRLWRVLRCVVVVLVVCVVIYSTD